MTASISPAVSFAALTVARDFSAWSFFALQDLVLDLQIFLPGNRYLIQLLQVEISRREDALPKRPALSWVEALQLPF